MESLKRYILNLSILLVGIALTIFIIRVLPGWLWPVIFIISLIVFIDKKFPRVGRFAGPVLGLLLIGFILYYFDKTAESHRSDYAQENAAIETQPVSPTDLWRSSHGQVRMGGTLDTKYFAVTLNWARISDRISTGNEFLDLPKDAGNNYLILNLTFKNTDNESRMLTEGDVFITYNGKDYLFDKSETIMAPGWGMLFEQINPMVTKTTNLVYKIPADISGPAYYNPGRSDREELIFIGNLKPFYSNNRYQ